jgi:hypothetical protein
VAAVGIEDAAEIVAIIAEWVDFLRHKKLWGDDDPVFPATEVGIGETGRFSPVSFRDFSPLRRSRFRTVCKTFE